MSELYDRIVEQRGSFERLVARIPGFRGYQEKQARRTADRMIRDHIAEQLQKNINDLVRIENKILDKIGMTYITKTREVKSKMQTFHDRVQTAAPGYDGMWAQMKIGPEELEHIYNFDEALIRYSDRFGEALDALEQAIATPDTLEAAVEAADAVATEANEAFALRDDVLTNLSKTLE